jgi:hypothetical protein
MKIVITILLLLSFAAPVMADVICLRNENQVVCQEDTPPEVTKSIFTVAARYIIIPLTEELVKQVVAAWVEKYHEKPGKVTVKGEGK